MIEIFALIQLGIAAFLGVVIVSCLRHHKREVPFLSSLEHPEIDDGVLIIVPAKDEESAIGACLERLAGLQGLKNFKIIAVDDRSIDKTAEKMEAARSKFSSLIEICRVKELPSGWLGKNHACWNGVQAGLKVMPDAKYFLFTDGDVKLHPQTLSESIGLMKTRNAEFLTLLEDTEFEGVLEPAILSLFGMIIVFFAARPWLLFKPNGRNFMGNGAYMLIGRSAYERTGGHQTLKLEVVEDMRMGLLMRSRKVKCLTAIGRDRMHRRWQPGFLAVFKGLIKNTFAGFEYDIAKTIGGILVLLLVFVAPWFLLFTSYWALGLLNLFFINLLFLFISVSSHLPWFTSFILSPFMAIFACANILASAFYVLRNDGVSWRGTHYPLKELKAHCFTEKRAWG